MTGRLKDIWRAPYPAYITSWKTVAVPAAIIFLILYLLEPLWLYVAWLTGMMLSFRLFFIVLLWVLILGAFPTVLFALWNRNIQLARNLCEARKMNQSLPVKPEVEKPSSVPLVFLGDTREMLEIDAMSFLYAESEGNYVRLHYLSPHDQLHRVTRVDGNSQGCRLRLEGCSDEVPVSRSYVKGIKALLLH